MKNNYVSNLLEYRYAVNTYITVLTESGYFSEAATDKQRKKLLSESVQLTEDICSFKKKFPEELKSKRQELNEQGIPQILKAIFGGAKAAEAGKAASEAGKVAGEARAAREGAPLPPLGKSAQGVLKDTTAGKPSIGLVPEVLVKVPETVSPSVLSQQRISQNELNQLRGYVMRQYSDALAETMRSGAGQFKNAEELHKAVMKKVSESGPLFKLPQEELSKIINTEALMPMSKSAFEGKGFLPAIGPVQYQRTADDIRMGLKSSDLRLQKMMQLEKAQAEYEQLYQVVSAMVDKGMRSEISPKVFGRVKDLESNITKLEQDIAILGAETKYAEPEVPKLPSTETERAVSGIESTEAKAAELKASLEAKRRARLSDEERALEDKLRETNPKVEVIPDRRRLGTDKGTSNVGKEVAPKVTELETGESKGGLNTPASVESPETPSPRIVPSAQPTVTPGTVETPSIPTVTAEPAPAPQVVPAPTVPAKARTATPETPTLGGASGEKPAGSKATRKPAQAQPSVTPVAPEVPQVAEPAPAPQVVPAPTVPAKGSRVKPSSQPAALPNVSGEIAPAKRPAPAPQPTVTPEPQKQPQPQPQPQPQLQPQGKPQNKNKTDTEEQVTPETKTQPETQGPKPPAPPTTTVLDKVVPAGLAIAGVVGKLFGEEKPKIGGGTKYPSPAGSEPSGAVEDIDVHFSRGKLGSGAITGVYRIV